MRLFPAALAAALLAGLAFPAPAAAQKLNAEEIRLDNGMKFIVIERHDSPRVFCAIFFKVGSVNETVGHTGLSHMLEHMMFKGTRTIGVNDCAADAKIMSQIDEAKAALMALQLKKTALGRRGEDLSEEDRASLKSLQARFDSLAKEEQKFIVKDELSNLYEKNGGTFLNASTGEDSTQYFVELPSNKVELFFWLESDRIGFPIFREFYQELDVVKEERRMRTDSTPTGLIEEAYESMIWQESPYHAPVIGWPSDLDYMRREDAEAHFALYYAPNNAVGLFVGDVDTEQVRILANKYFGRLPRNPKEPPPVVTTEPKQVAERRMEASADAPDSVDIIYHAAPMSHPDFYTLTVLAEVLNGRTGRLYKHLVEGEKLALEAGATPMPKRLEGSFGVSGRPKEGVSHEDLEAALLRELDAIKKEPIPDRELQKVKNQYEAQMVQALRQNIGIAFLLGMSELMSGDWRDYEKALDKIRAVTPEMIQESAKKTFVKSNRNILWIKRKKGSKAVAKGSEEDQIRMLVDMYEKNPDSIKGNPAMKEQILGASSQILPKIKDPELKKKIEAILEDLKKE